MCCTSSLCTIHEPYTDMYWILKTELSVKQSLNQTQSSPSLRPPPLPLWGERPARGSGHHSAPRWLSIRAVQRCWGPWGPGRTSQRRAARRGHTGRPEPDLHPPLPPCVITEKHFKTQLLSIVFLLQPWMVTADRWLPLTSHEEHYLVSGFDPFRIKAHKGDA